MKSVLKISGCLFGLILFTILAVSASSLAGELTRCPYPVSYRLGSLDPRFHLSKETLLKIAQQAEERWEASAKRELFRYDPQARLAINLIYDSRQATLDAINKAVSELNRSALQLDTWQKKLSLLLTDYQNDLERYNQEVDYYNRHGGAPQDVYARLLKEKEELEKRRKTLNQNIALFNLQINQHNTNLELLKSQIEQSQNKIITQGFYNGATETIDVYTFGNEKELRLVLMHEMGHALGLSHAQNPHSIMYPVLQEQNLNDPKPSAEDLSLLKNSCGLERYKSRLIEWFHSLFTPLLVNQKGGL
jgi:predicted Zn-dependent protease